MHSILGCILLYKNIIMTKDKLRETNVSDIVTQDIRAAHIFKKYGIDFCCGGGISVAKACVQNNVEVNELLSDLIEIQDQPKRGMDYKSWDLNFLLDYIINVHHSYVMDSIPLIQQYADKVEGVHGALHPELHTINKTFQDLSIELAQHLSKEEDILFPYVRTLELKNKQDKVYENSEENPLSVLLEEMDEEHNYAGDAMKKISDLTSQYNPPVNACNTYRALYAKLAEFEEDLHMHVHLENNILFPKVKALEMTLKGVN